MFNKIKVYPYTREFIDKVFCHRNVARIICEDYINIDFSNPKVKIICRTTVFVLAFAMFTINVFAATNTSSASALSLWENLLKYTRLAAYGVFVDKSLETIIKGALDENLEHCWKKVVGYILGFALVKYIPQIFDAINVMK
jgi:hypothetical protein